MRLTPQLTAIVAGIPLWSAPLLSAVPLGPTKPWVLDYAETQCLASREYGTAADPLTLAIRPAPSGETYELILARKRSGPWFADELEGTVDFRQGPPIKAWVLHYGAKTDKLDLYTFRIDAASMVAARMAKAVTLHSKGGPDVSFGLDSMPALLKGLEDCTADLKRYWKMDGQETGELAVPTKGDIRRVFSDSDYPTEAFIRQQEGTSQFLLLIDEKGKVAGCHVLTTSGNPVLDGMGCSVIRERARFKPARDKAGKPTRSTYTTPPVTWRIASD
jgi:TonB family protein